MYLISSRLYRYAPPKQKRQCYVDVRDKFCSYNQSNPQLYGDIVVVGDGRWFPLNTCSGCENAGLRTAHDSREPSDLLEQ